MGYFKDEFYEYELSYAEGSSNVLDPMPLEEKEPQFFNDEYEAVEAFEMLVDEVLSNAPVEYDIIENEPSYFHYEDNDKMIIIELKSLAYHEYR